MHEREAPRRRLLLAVLTKGTNIICMHTRFTATVWNPISFHLFPQLAIRIECERGLCKQGTYDDCPTKHPSEMTNEDRRVQSVSKSIWSEVFFKSKSEICKFGFPIYDTDFLFGSNRKMLNESTLETFYEAPFWVIVWKSHNWKFKLS